MANLLAYVEVLLTNWWAVTTITIPPMITELVSRIPWVKSRLDNLSADSRKWFRIALPLLGVCIAGFLAWQDEHIARERADKSVQDILSRSNSPASPASRIEVFSIEPENIKDKYQYTIKLSNAGSISANLIASEFYLLVSDTGPNNMIANQIMERIEGHVRSLPDKIDNGFDISPGNAIEMAGFPLLDIGGDGSTKEYYDKITAGTAYLYVYGVVIYRDASMIMEDQRRELKYCAAFTKTFSKWSMCPGQNRTFTWRKE